MHVIACIVPHRVGGALFEQSVWDGLARCRLDRLTPAVVQAAMSWWADGGASVAMISGRYAVLHAAISWAIAERLLRFDPLVGMRAPPRPYPRKHLPPELVSRLIVTAERRREKAAAGLAEHPGSHGAQLRLFRADQDVLMVRLVADAGLRRGELAGLRIDDLDGRVLLIERAAKWSVSEVLLRLIMRLSGGRRWPPVVRVD